MLYTFFHETAPRSFGLHYSPDWFDHVESGALSLVVVLHGGNQNIAAFAANVRIRNLIKGVFHDDVPQKLVAIFPVGLSATHVIGGSWEAGHVGGEADGLGLDDVSFVFACVGFVDQLLSREMDRQRALGRALPVVTSVFAPGRRFVMGFSNGAAMVARVLATRPGYFRAAAMHSHIFSGWKFTLLRDPLSPDDPDLAAGFLPIEANDPSAGDPGVSLFHLVGSADDRIMAVPGDTSVAGTPPDTADSIDLYIGANSPRLAAEYYRYDEAIDESLERWAANSISSLVVSPAWTTLLLYKERSWSGTYASGEAAELRQIIVQGLGHAWWYEDDVNNSTKMFWDFFQDFAVP
jgi:poly(3-hydroxybutyrate) depolymerase